MHGNVLLITLAPTAIPQLARAEGPMGTRYRKNSDLN